MPNIEKIDPDTGELMTLTDTAQPLAVQLAQAELNQAVTTAKAFPRSVTAAVRNIMSLASLDDESAAECVYALPRGGKPIKGPSIRFAEIVASQWGNCHTASRVVSVDRFDKVVIAEGVFLDLETGMKRTAQIRRRITDKHGNIFNDDMITVTGNAASSIAMREAILKGIPKAVWRQAYERCEKVIAGDIKTLVQRRDEAMKGFAAWGITPEQVFAALDVGGMDDVGLDELATLGAMVRSIKAGEQKVEDYFPPKTAATDAATAAKGTAAKLGKIAEQGKGSDGGKAAADPKGKSDKKAEQQKPADDKPAEGDRLEVEEEVADADEGAGTEAKVTDEQVEAAFQKGAEAKRKGMSRKSMPAEYRTEGMEELADAFGRGFTEADAA